MQVSANVSSSRVATNLRADAVAVRDQQYSFEDYKVIRRNGAVVGFEPAKITVALTKAFIAVSGGQGAASARIRELVANLTEVVVRALMRRQPAGGTVHIEDIQDQVELALMRSGEHEVARSYVLYRDERNRKRARQKEAPVVQVTTTINVTENGNRRPLDIATVRGLVKDSCEGVGHAVDVEHIMGLTLRDLYDGVPMDEVRKSVVLASRSLIEKDPAYSYVTARLLLNSVRHEVLGEEVSMADMHSRYASYFPGFIKKGIEAGLLDERLGRFDLAALASALDATRDLKFGYLGLQTLDRKSVV